MIAQDVEHRLELRAEEIVKIVEQIQQNYNALEQEMRMLVETKTEKSSITTKPILKKQHIESRASSENISQTLESKMQTDYDHSQLKGSNTGLHRELTSDNISSNYHLAQKVNELKEREKQLLEQLSFMKEQMKF